MDGARFSFGGEGGIRTHVGFPPTRFRDEPLKPLGHPSAESLPVRKELLDVIGGAGTYYAGIGERPFLGENVNVLATCSVRASVGAIYSH